MSSSHIIKKLEVKEVKPEELVDKVIKNPKLLKDIFEGIFSDKGNIKFGCAKILRVISEKKPKILYPNWDFFVKQLDNENNILKWNAIYIIANLSTVDTKNKFEKIFDRYFQLIKHKKMVTAANVVGGAGLIAKAKPHLEEKITKKILEVDLGKWETSECRNVLLGGAILTFEKYFDQIKNKDSVIKLVKKCKRNRRKSTREKAVEFLNKFENYNNDK